MVGRIGVVQIEVSRPSVQSGLHDRRSRKLQRNNTGLRSLQRLGDKTDPPILVYSNNGLHVRISGSLK